MTTVVVTGVAGSLGLHTAIALLQRGHTVIGVDQTPPLDPPSGMVFVPSSLRRSSLLQIFRQTGATCLVQLAGDFETDHVANAAVVLALEALSAARDAGIAHVVVRSSTVVYGFRPCRTLWLPTDAPLASPHQRWLRHWLALEQLVAQFQHHPTLTLTLLRSAWIVSPDPLSIVSRYLALRFPPMICGFDPLIQVVALEDVALGIAYAVEQQLPGVFHLAAEQPLTLSQAICLSGRVPAALPGWAIDAAWFAEGLTHPDRAPLAPDVLRYPCLADLRQTQRVLGFVAQHSPAATLQLLATRPREE